MEAGDDRLASSLVCPVYRTNLSAIARHEKHTRIPSAMMLTKASCFEPAESSVRRGRPARRL